MKKHILLCFVDNIENSKSFENFVRPLHEQGMELHLLTGTLENNLQPHQVVEFIETMFKDRLSECNFSFLTNIKGFFQYMYLLYHETFTYFIFYDEYNVPYNIHLEPFFLPLLNQAIADQAQLYKSIYTNINSSPQNQLQYINKRDLTELIIASEDSKKTIQVQRLYYIEDEYYMFEASDGENIVISTSGENLEILPSVSFNFTSTLHKEYLTTIFEMCSLFDQDGNYFINNHEKIEASIDQFVNVFKTLGIYTQSLYLKYFEQYINRLSHFGKFYLLTVVFHITSSGDYYLKLVESALDSKQLSYHQKYFLLFQFIRINFMNVNSNRPNQLPIKIRQLYHHILNQFILNINSHFSSEVKVIPKEERNPNLVFMFTTQFLDLNHGPTKTALDRCYQLMKHMGKQVVLINTCELLTSVGYVPFYNSSFGKINRGLDQIDKISYKDIEVPYYQPSISMPNANEALQIMGIVAKYKPYMIIAISGTSITTDLCGQLVPVVTISTVNSGLQTSNAIFDVIGRKITEVDKISLAASGKTEQNIIESVFTFDFKPQTKQFTRQELGLPEEQFILALIGGRLNDEVSEELLDTLLQVKNTHIVFIGPYHPTKSTVLSRPEHKNRFTTLGFQSDVLGILEVVDLYINPLRTGGATSAVESLYKEKPVVTINYGDVYVAVGDEFAVKSFEEMRDIIQLYVTDSQFYLQKSQQAKQLSIRMMDTRGELERIIEHVENSPLFF